MSHKSILENIASITCIFPTYFSAAGYATDPVERMKFVMIGSIAALHPTHHFDKPLNPVLGETFQAKLIDGTEVFLEQTCHHPPISSILVDGPENIY